MFYENPRDIVVPIIICHLFDGNKDKSIDLPLFQILFTIYLYYFCVRMYLIKDLNLRVPSWSVEDVTKWVNLIGFGEYGNKFIYSHVDGDLLLQLNEADLRYDIGIENGIRRQHFKRELKNLQLIADYGSGNFAIWNFLKSVRHDFCIYTYPMIKAGINEDSLMSMTDDQLLTDCGIEKSIHRLQILKKAQSLKYYSKNIKTSLPTNFQITLSCTKSKSVYISYQNSGSDLTHLLNAFLRLHGYEISSNVIRKEINKSCDQIRKTKNFVLVLEASALDKCNDNNEQSNWFQRVRVDIDCSHIR